MSAWRREGWIPFRHRGLGRSVALPFQLWTEVQAADALDVHHPCVIIHGVNDEIIPIDLSRALQLRSPAILRLIEVDDGHRLNQSLDALVDAIQLMDALGA